MNRAQRRRNRQRKPPSAQQIRELERKVEATGQPGHIHGLTHACRDCHATGALTLLPGHRAIGHIYHDDGCPAAAGITTWQPHPTTRRAKPTGGCTP
jgi:hypothetical protein